MRSNSFADSSAAHSSSGRSCPVRSECLAYAVGTVEPFGIWGGATERERRRMRRSGRPLAARACGWCRSPFTPTRGAQLYCGPEHARLALIARKAKAKAS